MFNYLILNNVLSEFECQKIIDTYQSFLGEEIEFGDYKHSRYDFKNLALSELIFDRIKDQLPECILELSHRWCMSKYAPDSGHISEHFDGNILYGDKISKYTFLLYLNDDFEKGLTVLSDPAFRRPLKVAPTQGRVLLLEQDLLHYAEKPQKKSKYILRSDLMVNAVQKI